MKRLLVALAALVEAHLVFADPVVPVAGDPGATKSAIQNAITAAGADGTVELGEGVFEIDGVIEYSNGITIHGQGWDKTIVKASGSGFRLFKLTGGARLEGVTVTGATAASRGAGIHVENGSVSWCCVSNNECTAGNQAGGGFSILKGSVDHCVIAYNKNAFGWGGGLGGNKLTGDVTVDSCLVYGNYVNGSSSGGVAFDTLDTAVTVTVKNCTITGNKAANGTNCGGFYFNNGGKAKVVMVNDIITGNFSGTTEINTMVMEEMFDQENSSNCLITGVGTDFNSCYKDVSLMSRLSNVVTQPPTFVKAAADDYRLDVDSPGVHAGAARGDAEVDLNGVAYEATPSIGCYEYVLVPGTRWKTGEGVPADWTPLENNLLVGKTGTTTGTTSFLTPVADNIGRITDGVVPTSRSYKEMLGFGQAATVAWDFEGPMTLETVRITSCDITDGRGYDDIRIADVMVKKSGSDDWVSLDCGPVEWKGSDGQGIMLYVQLVDAAGGPIAQNVTGLLVKFGPHNNVAQYYSEIEAAGFGGAYGPVVGSLNIVPGKTRATVSGLVSDAGTDATACDIYLSLNGTPAVKIAEGMTGSFEYQIDNLTAGTTYAYDLTISNNADPAKETVRSGSFTTMSASEPTTVWKSDLQEPPDWVAFEHNVLANMRGTMDQSHQPNGYGTNDLIVLTDGVVPSAEGKDWVVGIGKDAEITWEFVEAKSIAKLRISSAYLADTHFSGVNIDSVKVKYAESDEWSELPGSASGRIAGNNTAKIVCATFSDAENDCLAQNIIALKIVFGSAVYANANYYAEIEAVEYIPFVPVPTVADPVVTASTTFTRSVEVSMSCDTEEATIYYTLDGKDPTDGGTVYDGTPLVITETTTVKAVAMKEGANSSAVVSATYTKVPPPIGTLIFLR